MSLTYDQLAAHLPPGAISGQTVNFTAFTGGVAQTSFVAGLPVLLEGVTELVAKINAARAAESPPLPPLILATKIITQSTNTNQTVPQMIETQYTFVFEYNINEVLNQGLDPTDPVVV